MCLVSIAKNVTVLLREALHVPHFLLSYLSIPFKFGRTGRQWFWPLLPKQKWLGFRADTRQHRTCIDSNHSTIQESFLLTSFLSSNG